MVGNLPDSRVAAIHYPRTHTPTQNPPLYLILLPMIISTLFALFQSHALFVATIFCLSLPSLTRTVRKLCLDGPSLPHLILSLKAAPGLPQTPEHRAPPTLNSPIFLTVHQTRAYRSLPHHPSTNCPPFCPSIRRRKITRRRACRVRHTPHCDRWVDPTHDTPFI